MSSFGYETGITCSIHAPACPSVSAPRFPSQYSPVHWDSPESGGGSNRSDKGTSNGSAGLTRKASAKGSLAASAASAAGSGSGNEGSTTRLSLGEGLFDPIGNDLDSELDISCGKPCWSRKKAVDSMPRQLPVRFRHSFPSSLCRFRSL
eukprot:m.81735 g.81735  ORF g.81735 m.81735 type:complete len:149 (+) comp14577_c0_seq24:340-786(+)